MTISNIDTTICSGSYLKYIKLYYSIWYFCVEVQNYSYRGPNIFDSNNGSEMLENGNKSREQEGRRKMRAQVISLWLLKLDFWE